MESQTSLTGILKQLEDWEKQYIPRTPHHVRPAIRTFEERAADRITALVGSMSFVYFHTVWFGLWVAINLGAFAIAAVFDPFPFGLLTLVVSLEAIFLSTFVMISQNRQAAIADHRAELDYQVNVQTESEVAKVLMLVQGIAQHLAEEQKSGAASGNNPL